MWASASTANNAVVGADIIRPPPGLLYGLVEPERRHDGLLHGVGPLGGELVVADAAHKAAGLGPAHGLGSTRETDNLRYIPDGYQKTVLSLSQFDKERLMV